MKHTFSLIGRSFCPRLVQQLRVPRAVFLSFFSKSTPKEPVGMSTVITLCHPLPVLLVPQSPPVAMAQLQRGVFLSRGGGRYGNPPSNTPRGGIYYFRQPPIGVVVGAGAVGALTGTSYSYDTCFLRFSMFYLMPAR